jgi:hypothetical protein
VSRGCLGGIYDGVEGMFRHLEVFCDLEKAQVELKSGQVLVPARQRRHCAVRGDLPDATVAEVRHEDVAVTIHCDAMEIHQPRVSAHAIAAQVEFQSGS